MAVPPQPPSAVTALPPGLAASTAMSSQQQPPAGPLPAVAWGAVTSQAAPLHTRQAYGKTMVQRPSGLWEEAAPQPGLEQPVPDWTYDASWRWSWTDWDNWRWTDARGWCQVPMQREGQRWD